MAWVDGLTALMAHTVQFEDLSSLSTDGYGTPVFASATTYTARVVRKQQLVKTFEGIEELATTVVWVASTSTFSPSGQWTLPDGTSPTLLSMETPADEDGITHTKLYFG